MKRLVTFIKEDNKNIVTSISAPLNEDDLDINIFDENTYGLIDENFVEPIIPKNKKLIMYYNSETSMIDFEYSDIDFEDLSPADKIKMLKEENNNLKQELELTQMALFELDWAINGTEDETFVDENDDEVQENEENQINDEEDNKEIDEENQNSDENSETSDEIENIENNEENIENSFNLQEILNNAQSGDTIILSEDVNLTEEISTNKTITIDLNGHNITSNTNVIYLRSPNADLSIIGEGNIRAGSGGDYFAARVQTGKLTIYGGNWSVGSDASENGNSCIYASGSGEIVIKGGTFSTDVPYNDKYYVLNRKNGSTSTIVVYGGLFYNYNPEDGDDADGGNFIADGYKSVFNEEMQAWQVIIANVDNEVTENTDDTVDIDIIDESTDENIEENDIINDTIETENIEENDIIDENIEDTTLETDDNVNESLEESETSETESNIDSNVNETDVSNEDLEASDEVSE